MNRSDAKQACKEFMLTNLGDLKIPACKTCLGQFHRNRSQQGCAECVLILEEWQKLQKRLQAFLRKELQAQEQGRQS